MGALYLPNGLLWGFLCNNECLQNKHRPKGDHHFPEPRGLGRVQAWIGWFQSGMKRWKSVAYHLSLLLYILQELRTGLSSSVKCWNSNSVGAREYIKEGLELTPMGSFDIEQRGH